MRIADNVFIPAFSYSNIYTLLPHLPIHQTLIILVDVFNPNTLKKEEKGSWWVQTNPCLHSEPVKSTQWYPVKKEKKTKSIINDLILKFPTVTSLKNVITIEHICVCECRWEISGTLWSPDYTHRNLALILLSVIYLKITLSFSLSSITEATLLRFLFPVDCES